MPNLSKNRHEGNFILWNTARRKKEKKKEKERNLVAKSESFLLEINVKLNY